MNLSGRRKLVENIRAYKLAFGRQDHRIGFAIKANYNPSLLAIVREEGLSAVAVSGNEVTNSPHHILLYPSGEASPGGRLQGLRHLPQRLREAGGRWDVRLRYANLSRHGRWSWRWTMAATSTWTAGSTQRPSPEWRRRGAVWCRCREWWGRQVQVLVRLNPRLPVSVHPYLATGGQESKFGVSKFFVKTNVLDK